MGFQFSMQALQAEEKVSGELMGSVVLTGLVVVFIALILLVLFVSLFGKVFTAAEKSKKNKLPEKTSPAPTISAQVVPEVEDGISDEVVAVITAAVSALNENSNGITYSVKAIKKAGNSNSRMAWSNAGIMENSRPF